MASTSEASSRENDNYGIDLGGFHGDSEESSSLIPTWKDDDSSSIGSSHIYRIPSVLEFTSEIEVPRPPSPSSLSYRTDIMGEDFQSLPDVNSVVHDVPMEMLSSAEQLKSFRRRLHSSLDMGNDASTATSLSGSQMSHRPQPSPSVSRQQNSSKSLRYVPFGRTNPRFFLLIGATMLIFLSTHENIQNSKQHIRIQHQQHSQDVHSRREEVAFPFVEVLVHSDDIDGKGYRRTSKNVAHENINLGNSNTYQDHNRHHSRNELPKYSFPKSEQRDAQFLRGGDSRNNLAMARAQQQARPIFVPDAPPATNEFQKPRERFVFDSSRHRSQQQQQVKERQLGTRSSSWTSWFASLVVLTMIADTGWKEYRRCRVGTMVSSRDE